MRRSQSRLIYVVLLSLLISSSFLFFARWSSRAQLDKPHSLSRDESIRECQTIHIGFVVVGQAAVTDFYIALKSILLLRTEALTLHILTDKGAELVLRHLFKGWQLQSAQLHFYSVEASLPDVEWIPTAHAAGKYGLVKLLYPKLLPHVHRLIAIDNDILFQADVSHLWDIFRIMNRQQAIAMAQQQSDWYLGKLADTRADVVWPAIGRGYNSGILLLDLDKLRRNSFVEWPRLLTKELTHRRQTGLADQDVLNLMSVHSPTMFFELPCHWNLQLHAHSAFQLCLNSFRPSVLHWNSPAKRATSIAHQPVFNNIYRRIQSTNGALVGGLWRTCGTQADRDSDPAASRMWQRIEQSNMSQPCKQQAVKASQSRRMILRYVTFDDAHGTYQCSLNNNPDTLLVVEAKSLPRAENLMRKHLRRHLEQGHHGEWSIHCTQQPRKHTQFDVTLVTHLSLDRWGRLLQLIASWQGPVSAAVFLSDAELDTFDQHVDALKQSAQAADLTITVMFRDAAEPYPVNQLRNAASKVITTSHLWMVDVDLIPTTESYLAIRRALPGLGASVAMVIPAFETVDYSTAPRTTAEVKIGLKQGAVMPFRAHQWPRGHNATHLERWLTADSMYDVQWEFGYEPYVVLSATTKVPYSHLLDGFGWNKVAHIRQLHRRGFKFSVLPAAAVVHYAHAPSLDLLHYRASKKRKACMHQIDAFIDATVSDV
eukprot:TRINITY_DN6689_c0_g1_i1.p1 TRINITY_DN6689_c0_g1~~TRINITY_DN6689_c0_g1_i1.p1  ORF type:complete len:711 (+),score=87.78 TRINITY_DN6689_c0_g1_i1:84-2216(+)